jgi:predicted dehydrogenase
MESRNGVAAAIASRGLGAAQTFADEMGIERAYGSYAELIADPDIDAIYNPLPNHLHAEWSIAAAEAGKPVLCEKPLAIDAAEAQRMVDAFKARGVLLAEAFMWRYHPQTAMVKHLLDDGVIGALRIMRSAFTFYMTPERRAEDIRMLPEMAGGSLMDVGCYCVNTMRFMTGEEPDRLTAIALWEPGGVDHNFVGTLGFPSGVLGHFDCGFVTTFHQDYELLGDAGRMYVESAFVAEPDQVRTIHVWRGDDHEAVQVPAANQYTLMVEDFADALIEGREPRFGAQDAVENMRALDRLYESARSAS